MKTLISNENGGAIYRTDSGVLLESYNGSWSGYYRPAGNGQLWLVQKVHGAPSPKIDVSIDAYDSVCRVFRNLTWSYNGSGQWIAGSAIHDDGSSFLWRVTVLENGTFLVDESDTELTTESQTFDSLENACWWCQWVEFVSVRHMREQVQA